MDDVNASATCTTAHPAVDVRGATPRPPNADQDGAYRPARLLVLVGRSAGAVCRLGADAEVIVGRGHNCDLVVNGDDVSRQHAVVRRRDDGRFVICDLSSSNGTLVNGRPVEASTVIEFGDQIALGAHCVLLFTHFDSAEEQLLEQQRLLLLGRVAAGVAHDLNNLLGVIVATKGYLDGLDDDARVGSGEVRECIEDIGLAVRRATDLTPRMLDFVRGTDGRRKQLDLSAICVELAQLARRTFDRRIVVEADIAPNLRVVGDRGQIYQILMNLVVNARDAMPEGGRLTIEARMASPLEAGPASEEGSRVLVRVADTGQGMDEAIQARIFEPFFTTKHGKSFGLGLATAQQLLVAHRGHIDVDSAPDRGTAFRVMLPAAEGPATRATEHQLPATRLDFSARRILLVDDDLGFSKAAARLLRRIGHEIERSSHGAHALAAYERAPHDVVIVDLDMPEVTGEDVLDALAQMANRPAAIVLTGHAGGDRVDALREQYPSLTWVSKPAEAGELQRAIAECLPLDGPPATQDTPIRPTSTLV